MNIVKNKLNIIGRCYVKKNKENGEILSFIPDVPITGYLDDFLFILTVPNEDQKFAPAYVRLQDKSRMKEIDKTEEIKEFTEVRAVCYIRENKQKRGDIIICAPRKHVLVDFSKLVFIATIPAEDRNSAPCYFKRKIYEKSKTELVKTEILSDSGDYSADQIDEIMKEIVEEQTG